MPWIPHVMVLDDDARVLDSLLPSFPGDLGRALAKHPAVSSLLHRGEGTPPGSTAPLRIKVSATGLRANASPPIAIAPLITSTCIW